MPPQRAQPPGCFWGCFLFVGLAVFAGFAFGMVLPAMRAQFFFVEARCTVLDKRLGDSGDDTWRPEIRIRYEVNGRQHDTWTYDAAWIYSSGRAAKEAILAGFVVGQQYPCWYDPANPDARAVLTRGLDWWMLIVLVPLVFVVIGAGGLIANRRQRRGEPLTVAVALPAGTAKSFGSLGLTIVVGFFVAAMIAFAVFFALAAWGAAPWAVGVGFFTPLVVFFIAVPLLGRRVLAGWIQRLPSPERRAAKQMVPQEHPSPAARVLGQVVPPPAGDWPTVPAVQIPTEPATTLAVRLRMDSGKLGCALTCLVPFTAVWVSAVTAFAVVLTREHARGQHNWGQTFFMVLLALIGLALVGFVFVIAAGLIGRLLAGRVVVELSAYPLAAGGRYECWAQQSGGTVPLRAVRVRLVCKESARYQQGTSTYTSTREVYSQDLLHPQDDSLAGGVRRPLEVPAGVMHSFAGANNQVSWSLQVRGRAGILPVRLDFPVIVYPAEGASHESA
jgi:hypothetical protein